MLLLDTFTDIGIYRVALILKYGINILLTILPIIVIIFSMIDIFKIVINPNEVNKSIKEVATRILAGIIVLFIPTIIDYSFSLIESYDNTVVLQYYNNASIEKIEELEQKYEEEREAEKNKREAEYKQAYIKEQEELKKQREQIEEYKKEQEEIQQQQQQQQGSTPTYTGDTIPDGNYGKVTVTNGVFYVPNQRASSDADTPKQSGAHGLNPVFWERLSKLINDGASNGHTITVTSGWRPYSTQRRLWDQSTRACSERNKWVACPGGSRHGWAIAADLAFNGTGCSGGWDCNSAAKWAHDNAAKYGLVFRMSWEPWHIEPSQVSGGSYGACTTPC